MNTVEKENVVYYTFDNVVEMAEFANKAPSSYYAKKERMAGFCELSFAEAYAKALNGDAKMTKLFDDQLKELKTLIMYEREGRIHDVTGECVDIGAYLTGMPECFIRRHPQPEKPHIKVVVNMSFSSSVSQTSINNRGAGIVSLVDELQDRGYHVNLILGRRVYYWFNKRKKDLQVNVSIRCDPIDISEIAFASTVSFTRRLGFACTEIYLGEADPIGHGSPRDMYIDLEDDEKAIVFVSSSNDNFYERNYMSLESTKNHILSMIDEIANGEKNLVYG